MTIRDAAGARALAAYSSAPRGDRFHVRLRWRTCPFAGVAARVPRSGDVLDLGCGHGLFSLYLAVDAPERSVTGIDVDAEKLAVASAAADAAAIPVRFERVGSAGLPDRTWEAITVVDVLYLLGKGPAVALLRAAVARLAPGGTIVVKEIATTPRWKFALANLQEELATRVLRITEGADVDFLPPDLIVAELEAAGLSVDTRRLDRGRLHPHLLIVGTASE